MGRDPGLMRVKRRLGALLGRHPAGERFPALDLGFQLGRVPPRRLDGPHLCDGGIQIALGNGSGNGSGADRQRTWR